MQKYPGHTIKDFFGREPMTAAQFFVLNAQIGYEIAEEKKARQKSENKHKGKRK